MYSGSIDQLSLVCKWIDAHYNSISPFSDNIVYCIIIRNVEWDRFLGANGI
jgi:hypothetical protein